MIPVRQNEPPTPFAVTGTYFHSRLGQVTTRDGHLVIVIEAVETHGLQLKSGMLQSWNKFCFTTGYIEGSLNHDFGNFAVVG